MLKEHIVNALKTLNSSPKFQGQQGGKGFVFTLLGKLFTMNEMKNGSEFLNPMKIQFAEAIIFHLFLFMNMVARCVKCILNRFYLILQICSKHARMRKTALIVFTILSMKNVLQSHPIKAAKIFKNK